MTWWGAVILGVLEGLTEFIPVSSTGHLILAGHYFGWIGVKVSTFEVFIQSGAILAVVVLFWDRLTSFREIRLLAITTAPAVFFGALAHSFIKFRLFNPDTVALGLAVGGVGLILIGRLTNVSKEGLDRINARDALWVGLAQCLALWPGVSRSGATIMGAMAVGIDRKTAAEYSFLAAVPVMFAATGYDLYKNWDWLAPGDFPVFLSGFVAAFASAWFSIRWFMALLRRHGLALFGWYRLILAGGIGFGLSG